MYTMVTIPRTSTNTEIISRQEIINWINKTLNFQYRKIEDLSSGAAYCLLMDILFPGCLSVRKIKVDARLEHEMLSNYKALQNAFRKCGIEKDIPIINLLKGRFQDHLLFSQWFKRFYDANYRRNFDKAPSGDSANLPTSNCTTPLNKSMDMHEFDLMLKSSSPIMKPFTKKYSTIKSNFDSQQKISVSPEFIGLRSEMSKMTEEFDEDHQTIADLTRERQFYYDKLCNIEILCHEYEDSDFLDLVSRVQEILFKEEEGFVSPTVND